MMENNEFIEKAKLYLKTAEVAIQIGDYDSSVSRSYYAMFYMVRALLEKQGVRVKTHKGAISKFHEIFVKSGIFPQEFSQILRKAHRFREIGDYGRHVRNVSKETAEKMLENAKKFVEEVEKYMKEKEKSSGDIEPEI